MMENQVVSDPEEAHYARMRVLKVLGLVLAICLACGLGALFGGGLVFGVMKLGEDSPSAEVPAGVIVEREFEVEKVIPAPSAVIVEVMPGSPAEDAGLQAGDVVLAVGGESLSAERGLAELVAEHGPGDRIRLAVTRPGEGQKEIRVRLAEHPDKSGAPYLGVRYAVSPPPAAPGSRVPPFEGEEGFDHPQMPFAMPGGIIERGVIVVNVTEGSPASAAGLQESDVIMALDGEPIGTPEQLVEAIGQHKAGDSVTLTFLREEDEEGRQVTVTLAQHPEDPDRAFLGIMIGGTMERRRFEGGQVPEGFDFRGGPYFFGVPGAEMPFNPEALPFNWDELPFDWDQLPFDPGQIPFDWHQLEPDFAPGDGSA